MKNKWLAVMMAAVMAAAVTACGGQSATTAETTMESAATTEAAPAETTEEAADTSAVAGSDDAATDASAETAEGDAFPVTIAHAFGETVIETKPERVATIAFGNQDVVLALDVVPVGFSAANYGVQDDSGMLPWTQEKLQALGETAPNVFQDTDGIDYEAVADCDPDIILAPYSGITQEEYDLLSEIAPVVAYPETAWTIGTEDWIRTVAKALGLTEKGEEIIAAMEDKIAESRAAHPEFEDKDFVWITFNETDLSALHAYSPEDTRCKFLEGFGFSYPESVSQYISEGSYSLDISAENADLLYDADFLIGYSTQEAYDAAAADAVLGSIPALQNGAVVSIENGTPLSASLTITPLSFDYCIDEYVQKLAEACANAQ